MSRPAVIVDYDPQWPVLYEEEKTRILRAIGLQTRVVEHIGSTAVPGLCAKPIIDLMAGVHRLTDANKCLQPLRKIDYRDVTPQPDNPEWYYCLGKGPHSIGYHLHLVKFLSEHWRKHLFFRDFLRTHRNVAGEYCRLKKDLWTKYGTDRPGYTAAKTSFIESVLLRARQQNVSAL